MYQQNFFSHQCIGSHQFQWFYTIRHVIKQVERVLGYHILAYRDAKIKAHQDPHLPYPLDISWEGVADVVSGEPAMQILHNELLKIESRISRNQNAAMHDKTIFLSSSL